MESTEAIQALSALAQETRLEVYRLLVEVGRAGLPAGEIAEELGLAAPTLSFHLKELVRAGLAAGTRDGRSIYYSADYGRMRELMGYLSANCCRRSRKC